MLELWYHGGGCERKGHNYIRILKTWQPCLWDGIRDVGGRELLAVAKISPIFPTNPGIVLST